MRTTLISCCGRLESCLVQGIATLTNPCYRPRVASVVCNRLLAVVPGNIQHKHNKVTSTAADVPRDFTKRGYRTREFRSRDLTTRGYSSSVMSVSGKVALVTGAAQGLGLAFAEELLKKGAKVAFTDINESVGQSTLSDLSSRYGENMVTFIKCDVTKETEVKESFQSIIEKLGSIDIMVNNAGIGQEFKGWEKTVEVNVIGTIRGSNYAIEHMRRDKGGNGGVIVNISSMAGINPNPCGPIYSATKGAIIMFSLSWAVSPELQQNGIRVNVLCPAFADTALFKGLTQEDSIHVPQVATMIQNKVGTMTPEYVAENMMELIEDETKNGAIMKLSQAGGKVYHKLT